MVTLSVQPRGDQSNNDIRAKGAVPAVFYGPKEKSTAITINSRELERVWKEAGETTIVRLAGIGEDKDALFKDVQFHPVTGKVIHADFYIIEKGKKVEIAVPLHFEGVAPAEKAGHILVKALHEIEIKVAPAELPHHLIVDVTKLENVGDHIVAKDIILPPSAELKTDPQEIVASITEFVEEKEVAPVAPAEAAPSAEGAASTEEKKD
jgi:large subunit ribosomal protein L25